MRKVRHTKLVLLVPAAFLASACSDSTGPGTNTPATLDVASLVAQTSLGSLENLGAALGGGIATIAPLPVASGCTYSSASQSFACPTRTSDGVTITVSYTLLDAGGHPQSAADPAKIDAIRTITDISGTLQLPAGVRGGTVTMASHRDVTLSGLLAAHYLLNGTGATSSSSTFGAAGSSETMSGQERESIVNVAVPPAGSATPWPTSGTIFMDVTSTFAGLPPLTSHMTMTFAEGGVVTFVITTDSITTTCHVNMNNPGGGPSCA